MIDRQGRAHRITDVQRPSLDDRSLKGSEREVSKKSKLTD